MACDDLSFYGDESGSNRPGTFVLSGCLGRDDEWEKFEQEWHNVLTDESIGGRSIDYFHMRDCYKLDGVFEGFTRSTADRKLFALVDVLTGFLRTRRLVEFTMILDWDIYNEAVDGPIRDIFHDPYLFAMHGILSQVTTFLNKSAHPEAPLWFWMDDQTPSIEANFAHQFCQTKKILEPEHSRWLDAVAFKSDKSCYQLQAADLIAWQRHRRELRHSEDDRNGRREWRRLNRAAVDKSIGRFTLGGLTDCARRINTKLQAMGCKSGR